MFFDNILCVYIFLIPYLYHKIFVTLRQKFTLLLNKQNKNL